MDKEELIEDMVNKVKHIYVEDFVSLYRHELEYYFNNNTYVIHKPMSDEDFKSDKYA